MSHVGSGVAGGLATAAILYGFYSYSTVGKTASSVNKTVAEVNKQIKTASDSLQKSTPNTDQAINYIKEFAYSYVGWIPGGRQYVDAAFKDFDTIHRKHRDEVDKIVKDTSDQIQDIAKAGVSMESAHKAMQVLSELGQKIADLTMDAASDVLGNHPEVKKKLGGSFDQLQSMSEEYGPEAQKQVEAFWKDIKGVFATGFSEQNVEKAKKLAEDKVKQISEMGDKAWKQALEQAKPYLDKSPKVKQLIEENSDTLKKVNPQDLFDKVRKAIDSDNVKDLEKYVWSVIEKKSTGDEQAKDKDGGNDNKDSGFDFGLLSKVPNADQVLPKLQSLKETADKHKDSGEKLLKETMDELKKVLDQQADKAQELAKSAKEDVENGGKEGKGR